MFAVPFFTLSPIHLGPLPLQPFGILVATGVLFGSWVLRKRAETIGLDEDEVRSCVGWVLICGFIGAHLFDVLAYTPGRLKEDPLLLFKVWAGISSYGGFIGATVGWALFCHRFRVRNWMAYADIIGCGVLPGFTFGRMGCSLVHDHVGAPAESFFLATNFTPEAVASHGYSFPPGLRHDLGLYELLYLLAINLLFYLIMRKARPLGFPIAFAAITYAPVRFFLDYLRMPGSDPRYLGLTFAQYVSVLTLVVGVLVMRLIYRRHARSAAAAAATTDPPAPAPAARKRK